MKTYLIAAGFVAASALSASAFGIGIGVALPGGGGGSISIGLGADGSNAVICAVSDVTVLASSDADCTTIGGTVTHTIDSNVTPAG